MTPTNELRWVECTIPIRDYGPEVEVGKIIQVLQQKWVIYRSDDDVNGFPRRWEWRDVPLVKE